MRDTKAFASLTSGLLARKGQARPAMRPQGFTSGFGQADDLGWNDMGFDVAPPRPGPRLPANLSGARGDAAIETMIAEPPAVIQQQADIAREFAPAPAEAGPAVAEPAPAAVAPVRATLSQSRVAGRKAAFTLRLDAERHLRLRLACAVAGRSAQMLVTDALDQFLASQPDVERLATSLPDAGAKPAR